MLDDVNSHDVSKQVTQENKREYAEALGSIEGARLFHKLHLAMGRQITEI